MFNRIAKLVSVGFMSGALLPLTAYAVEIPNTAQPGRANRQMQIEEARPEVGGATVITVPDDNGGAKKMDTKTTFVLKGVSFENLTAFNEEEMRAEYADLIGTKVNLQTVNGLAAKITARYRNAGYILSRAVVPPQSIKGGVVKIKIVEGYINNVTVEGVENSALINGYIEKLRNARPLNTATLERYLLLIQDLPGVTASAVLRPSATAPGASDIAITVLAKKIDGAVNADNRGSRYLGPYQGGVTVNANNMLGLYDRTQFRGLLTSQTSELKFFQISHDEQLDSEGTKLTLSAGRAYSRPGYRLKALDVKGIDTTYSASVTHPFIRSRTSNLFGTAVFDVRNTENQSAGIDLYADRLHVARIGGAYDFVDRFTAVNRFDAQLSKGFGWNDNPSPNVRSRDDGDTSFWKGTMNASRLQNISGPFGVLVAATGQVASGKLLASEQIGVGGADFGSAYDPSEILGDSGLAGRAELQFSQPGNYKYLNSYQLYTFYDVGKVWTRNPSIGTNSADSLASAGLGVRFNVIDQLSGNVELAVPLTRDVAAYAPNHGDDPRVFFSLAYRY